jgi:DNA-binding NarL/FixJ family response regulator
MPYDIFKTIGATGSRILLVGAHRAFLEALATRLAAEAAIDSVPIAGLEQILLMLVRTFSGVVVVESASDTMSAAEVVRVVRRKLRTASVVVVSTSEQDDAEQVAESLLAGARGWIEAGASVDELVRALRVVLAGGLWLSPDLLESALHVLQTRHVEGPTASFVDRLTPREREVLDHLAAGRSRPEIARAMSVSPDTVRTHVQNVLKKAEVHSTLAALAKARRSTGTAPTAEPAQPEASTNTTRRSHP